MNHVLIVEDERPIADLIAMTLRRAGYECSISDDGLMAADMLAEQKYDLILLDVMLPGIDGFALMEFILPLDIPVIFITAKGEVSDRIRGLHLGADDYITKPFDPSELLARVEAVLRRRNKLSEEFRVAGLTVNTRSRSVWRDGKEIPLTNKEYECLLLFARNRNAAIWRETIYERVWGSSWMGDSRTVDLHVQRLRRKCGWEDCLVSVRKVGYRLISQENESEV
ncbi:MAG: response regulator transcription factor [Clostridia bacterium]|nr:response regulator transcription factor [Clostridia bacterium]